MSESDIHSLEQEKDSLHRKVELLERAIESPNSQKILRRILERCVNVCYQTHYNDSSWYRKYKLLLCLDYNIHFSYIRASQIWTPVGQ